MSAHHPRIPSPPRRRAGFRPATILCLLAALPIAAAATEHTGGVSVDETWTLADSPHEIVGYFTIHGGATLTVESGAEVRAPNYVVVSVNWILEVEHGASLLFGYQSSLLVHGSLTASGWAGSEILFGPAGDLGWDGVQFREGGGGTLTGCSFDQVSSPTAEAAILLADGGVVTASDILFQGCVACASVSGGQATLSDLTATDGSHGVVYSGGVLELSSVWFSGLGGTGIRAVGGLPTLLDANIVLDGCGTGLELRAIAGLSLGGFPPISGCGSGVEVTRCETPFLDGLVLTGNDAAIEFTDVGEFMLGGGNAIGGPGLENGVPVLTDIGSWPAAGSAIPATGNLENVIRIKGGVTQTDRDVVWRAFPGIDYIVSGTYGRPEILAGGSLTVEPGVRALFGYQSSLLVEGWLSAAGTPGSEILFSRSGTMGWDGFLFAGAANGYFENCVLEHVDSPTAQAAIVQAGLWDVTLVGTTIRDCRNGVLATGGAIAFLNCSIVDNQLWGVDLDGAMPTFGGSLGEWNDIHGNGQGNLRNGDFDIAAAYVYWGTPHCWEIDDTITDRLDDPALGRVDFEPWCDADHLEALTGVGGPGPDSAPRRLVLAPVRPNPFNAGTLIRFGVPRPGRVRLELFDPFGRRIRTLHDGDLPAGWHAIAWRGRDDDGRAAASGSYLCRLTTGEGAESRKMTLLE